MMRKLPACFVLMVGSAVAAPIITSQVNCATGCSANAGAYFATVQANQSGSASARFQDDLVFTVTDGPSQGFFGACFQGFGDTYQGSDFASGGFAGLGATSTMRAFSFDTCPSSLAYNGPLAKFTLGLPIEATMLLSASVSTSGSTPQAFATVNFLGFRFFDATGNPIAGIAYSLEEAPGLSVPEPQSVWLLLLGLFCILLRTLSKLKQSAIHLGPHQNRRAS